MQRILVVEDDFDIQELLENFLQEAGYEVAVANDGVEALSLFAGQRYDLIVLDIMLPKIDGYGVCELIRKQSDVPIIMLSRYCLRMVSLLMALTSATSIPDSSMLDGTKSTPSG